MLFNDQQVASASAEGRILIWNIASSPPLQKIKELTMGAYGDKESPAGFTGLAYHFPDMTLLAAS